MGSHIKKGEKDTLETSLSIDKIRDAVESDEIPTIYANGFALIASNADVGLVLDQLGKPVAVIYLSNILAKTLVKQLGASLLQIEEALEQEFPTTADLEAARVKGENR